MMRQSHFSQGAGKAEAVQKAKAESDKPRPSRRQRRPPAPCIHDLYRDQHDAECNSSLDGRPRHVHEAERRRRQRDAVRNRERRHGERDAPPVPDQDHQRQDEQQIIESEYDVFDSKAQIRRCDFPSTGAPGQRMLSLSAKAVQSAWRRQDFRSAQARPWTCPTSLRLRWSDW